MVSRNSARLQVLLEMRDNLSRELGDVRREVQTTNNEFRNMALIGVGAVTAVGAGLFAMATETANTGEALLRMSQQTGISVESLSELRFALESVGGNMELLAPAIRRIQRVVVEGAEGNRTYDDSLSRIGVTIRELESLDAEGQFLRVAGAIGELESASDRTATAFELFGDSGVRLLPLVEQDIGELRDRAQELGVTFTTEAAEGAAEFNGRIMEVREALAGLRQELGLAFAEPVGEGAEAATDFISRFRENLDEARNSGEFRLYGGFFDALRETLPLLRDVPTLSEILFGELHGQELRDLDLFNFEGLEESATSAARRIGQRSRDALIEQARARTQAALGARSDADAQARNAAELAARRQEMRERQEEEQRIADEERLREEERMERERLRAAEEAERERIREFNRAQRIFEEMATAQADHEIAEQRRVTEELERELQAREDARRIAAGILADPNFAFAFNAVNRRQGGGVSNSGTINTVEQTEGGFIITDSETGERTFRGTDGQQITLVVGRRQIMGVFNQEMGRVTEDERP